MVEDQSEAWPPPPPSWSPPPTPPGPPLVPSGWSAPGGGPAGYPGAVKTNGLAIAALVVGCLGFAFCFVPSILAIVFGSISKSQIDRSQGAQSGRGLAIAGIVLGWVGVGIALLGAILLVILAATDSGTTVDTDNGIETLRALVRVAQVV